MPPRQDLNARDPFGIVWYGGANSHFSIPRLRIET
jgi:hypothetical protein